MNTSLHHRIHANLRFRTLAAVCCLMLTHSLVCSAALLFYGDEPGGLYPLNRADVNDAVSALDALATVPSAFEAGRPLTSGVLPDTKVLALQTEGDTTTVEFSPDILGSNNGGIGLDEARLTMILQQVRATLRQFGLEGSIRLQAGGNLLSSYLPPVTPVAPGPAVKTAGADLKVSNALGGRNITIGPSHGRFWNGSGWYWQRSDPCGFGEAVLEDCNSVRLMQFLYQYLAQDGATVHVPRELNESNCCNSYEGLHWWKMAAYSWLRANGLPCSVWASYTGNCGAENAVGRSSDDIRARPLFADYRGSDIYIAHHTNAGGGGTANGTETFRDTAMEHPAHEAASYNLALAVNNNVVAAIRDMYPNESGWSNRGVKDSAGGFGEIRIPNRPAILIELAFHDNCSRDAAYLTDNFFRSVSEWGLYKGVCEYFGTSPTWDKYSDEYVSDTIPTTMNPGQSYNVSVTFRNRGVVWSEARAFRLGANGGSDPFTAATRHTISGEVKPGSTYTFNFTMTAPTSAGTYTTDWRMVRDGYAWFGATLSKQVTVTSPGAPTITTQPVNQTVIVGDAASFSVAATGNAPLSYQWRRNGANLSDGGSIWGVTTTTLTITNVQPANAGTYTVLVSNTNGSTLSAGAVLTVQLGYPASWGPMTATTVRTIYTGSGGSQGSGTPRVAAYTTGGETARLLVGFNTTTAPDASLVSGGTFIAYHSTYANYSSTLTADVTIYEPLRSWTSAATWATYDGVNAWSTAGGTGAQLGSTVQSFVGNPSSAVEKTWTWATATTPVNGVQMKGTGEGNLSYRKGVGAGAEGPNPTLTLTYTAPTPAIRSWAYLGWYDQGATADRQLRIDTDQVAGTYGGVPVTEADVAPKVGGTSYGNSYGLRQWAEGTYTNDLVNLNSSYFYNAVHENAVTYCCVYVRNSKGSDITGAYLGIGSDDGCKVWWNGAVVDSHIVGRGVSADADFWGPITISNGWNRLMVKVENGGTGHGVYARFANANRTALTDKAHLSIYTSDNTAPSTPANLAVAGVTSGVWQSTVAAPTFTWTPGADSQGSGEGVSGVRGQKYYFGSDSGGSPNTFLSGTSFAPGAQADGQYYFKVQTIDGALNESDVASFAFLYDGTAPTGVSLGIGTVTTDSIEVTGGGTDAHSGISATTGYNYSRAGAGDSGAKGATHTWAGLVANTEYAGLLVTVSDQAVPTPNTEVSSPQSRWTLSVPPTGASVTPDQATLPVGSNVTWTAVNGFGPGQVQYYRYAWDTSATRTWTDTETQWSAGTLVTVPDTAGTWYLHVKGYNGEAIGNGTFDYAVMATPPPGSATALTSSQNPSTEGSNVTFTATVTAVPPATGTPSGEVVFLANSVPFSTNSLVSGVASADAAWLPLGTNTVAAEYAGDVVFLGSSDSLEQVVQSLAPCSQTNAIVNISDNVDGTFTITFQGTPQAQYYVAAGLDLMDPLSWTAVPDSTNTVASGSGLWSFTVTNAAPQRFYRSAAVNPCP